MDLKNTFVDATAKAANVVHRTIIAVSGGRIASRLRGMPAVELHTTGRKSGKPRSCMLTAPIHDEHMTVLIASKGGDDRHPEWYLNLTANPDVELKIAGETKTMTARTATAAEKAELWPRIVAANKGYGGYQQRTERDIPVVICEPR